MHVDLARRHHQQHQQRPNTNANHYMNASIPFSVSQSNASNYHLVSDPSGTNGNAVGAEDIHGSDSASSSAASSFVHLPLSGVDTRSLLVRGAYDNVSYFSYSWASICAHYSLWGSSIVIYGWFYERSFVVMSAVTISRIFSRRKYVFFFFPSVADFFLFFAEWCSSRFWSKAYVVVVIYVI